ncbi:hypothetical protein, partial [Salmonella enterica]|uniref:hypothetical protein n=1 Tax=Salmonella enterica TaxID=28901 RepID=UPI002FCD96B4
LIRDDKPAVFRLARLHLDRLAEKRPPPVRGPSSVLIRDDKPAVFRLARLHLDRLAEKRPPPVRGPS